MNRPASMSWTSAGKSITAKTSIVSSRGSQEYQVHTHLFGHGSMHSAASAEYDNLAVTISHAVERHADRTRARLAEQQTRGRLGIIIALSANK